MARPRQPGRRSWPVLVALGALAVVAVLAGVVWTASRGDADGVQASASPTPARSATTGHAVTAPAATTPATTPAAARPAPVGAFTPLRTPAVPAQASVRVPVLMFHRVASADTITNATSADLTVTPDRFAAEMAWLHRAGYHPVSETALFRALYDGAPLPQRPVVLTFDDGYVDDAVAVAPVLRRYGWTATFAIIAGRAGERAFLTWPQIVRLDREGMDIASHSMDHVELAGAGAGDLHRQLGGSRDVLAAHLGHPVYWFVYPAGSHDAAAEDAAAAAGYLLAYTTDPGATISSSAPMAAPRIRIHGADTTDEFAAIVTAAGSG